MKHWEVRESCMIMVIEKVACLAWFFFPTFLAQIEHICGTEITKDNVNDSLEWHVFMETRGIDPPQCSVGVSMPTVAPMMQ